MNFPARLQRALAGQGGPDELAELASDALAQGEEEATAPIVLDAAAKYRSARLWQWAGLLHRALEQPRGGYTRRERDVRLGVRDPGVARSKARGRRQAVDRRRMVVERTVKQSRPLPQ